MKIPKTEVVVQGFKKITGEDESQQIFAGCGTTK